MTMERTVAVVMMIWHCMYTMMRYTAERMVNIIFYTILFCCRCTISIVVHICQCCDRHCVSISRTTNTVDPKQTTHNIMRIYSHSTVTKHSLSPFRPSLALSLSLSLCRYADSVVKQQLAGVCFAVSPSAIFTTMCHCHCCCCCFLLFYHNDYFLPMCCFYTQLQYLMFMLCRFGTKSQRVQTEL